MNKLAVKARIERLIKRFASASTSKAYGALIPTSLTSGKLYEAHVLGLIIEALSVREGYNIKLINSTFLPLKSSPGPINRTYPFFELWRNGVLHAEIWTDVEFTSLSYHDTGYPNPPTKGDYHELDIAVTTPKLTGRLPNSEVWLGVECKNTGYTKNLLKEILGIRRELSYLQAPQPTRFSAWPRTSVPAKPASCLMVYATDSAVAGYSSPGQMFGIDFVHEPI